MKLHLAKIRNINNESKKIKFARDVAECNGNLYSGGLVRWHSHASPKEFIRLYEKEPENVCKKCVERFKKHFPGKICE